MAVQGYLGASDSEISFESPVSINCTLPAGTYPSGAITFNNINDGDAYWKNNNLSNPATVDLYLCDSEGNNRVFLFNISLQKNGTSTTLKTANIANAQALAGKALYLVATGNTNVIQLRKYTTITINTDIIAYDVIVNVGAGGSAVSNKAQAKAGETVTITSTPNSGYAANTPTASGITFTSAGTNKWTFTMPSGGRVAISCTFRRTSYNISYLGADHGTIAVNKQTAAAGETVTITLTPDTGYKANTPTSSPSATMTSAGTNKWSFTMPASDIQISASFSKVNYALTGSVSPNGGGSITLKKGSSTVSQAQMGDTITIVATPTAGWKLKSLSTSPSRTITDNKFTMPAGAVTVTAVFEKISYTITINNSGSNPTGTVTANKAKATVGEEVTLTVTLNTGVTFNGFTTSPSNLTITNLKFTMPAANVTLTPKWAWIVRTITISAGTGGTLTASKLSSHYGEQITLTPTPNKGYKLSSYTKSPSSLGISNNKFTMPNSDVSITANFTKESYAITKTVTPTGGGTITTNKNSANYGDTITVSQTPAAGYYFNGWETTPAGLIASGASSFTMPAQAVTVKAKYLKYSTATVNKKSVTDGDVITLSISADKATYSHKYKLSFGTNMETALTTVAAGTSSVNITLPSGNNSWAKQLPNAKTKSGTLIVETYNGNTKIGTYTITGMTYNVPATALPTLTAITASVARTIDGTTYANVGNVFVQGKCGVRIQTTGAGALNSTISKIEVTLSGYTGTNYNKTINSATVDYTTKLLTIAGTTKITAKVTDSRGNTATVTKNITVLAYSKPYGTLSVRRVDDNGNDDALGTKAKYTKTSGFSAVGNNALTVTLKSQGQTKVISSNTDFILASNSKQTFDRLTEYTIQLILQDSFETVTISAKLPTAQFMLFFGQNGDRMALMKAVNTSLSMNGKQGVIEFSEDSQIYIGTVKLEDYIKMQTTYQPGETETITNASAYGAVSSGLQNLTFFIHMPKKVASSSITITSLKAVIRGENGYIDIFNWNNRANEIIGTSGYTITPTKCSNGMLIISIDKDAAFTNVSTNNTPITVSGLAVTVTFNN